MRPAWRQLIASTANLVPMAPGLQTLGGQWGHRYRRLIHVLTYLAFPFIYFQLLPTCADSLHIRSATFIYILFFCCVVFEAVRLQFKKIFFGMRSYENKQVSAAAWALLGLGLVVLWAPSHGLAYTLCWTAGVVDPMVGELKKRMSVVAAYLFALLLATIIWLSALFVFNFTWWLVAIIPLATICAEYPTLSMVDDNFTILFVPLLILLLIV